jgi:hypothetical protein
MYQGADERSSFQSGAIKMGIETQIGWMLIMILLSAISFYTLGYNTGKKDGYLRGRASGLKAGVMVGKDRRVNNG